MIRKALADEAEILSGISFRSKAHWGYSDEFMEDCRAELSISLDYLHRNSVFVLVENDTLIGFYSLERVSTTEVELGHIFVEPKEIGRGYGRRLMQHACEQARHLGYQLLVIQADPNAEWFYLGGGARRVGSKPSLSILGRLLPLLELDLNVA